MLIMEAYVLSISYTFVCTGGLYSTGFCLNAAGLLFSVSSLQSSQSSLVFGNDVCSVNFLPAFFMYMILRPNAIKSLFGIRLPYWIPALIRSMVFILHAYVPLTQFTQILVHKI